MQLHYLEVFEGMLTSDSGQQQKMNVLYSINIVKENLGGSIKGQSVAIWRKLKTFYNKDEITSPEVSIDTLLTALTIDA